MLTGPPPKFHGTRDTLLAADMLAEYAGAVQDRALGLRSGPSSWKTLRFGMDVKSVEEL